MILTTMHLKIDRDHVDDDDDDTGHNDEYRGCDQHDHCFMIIAMLMEIEDDVDNGSSNDDDDDDDDDTDDDDDDDDYI